MRTPRWLMLYPQAEFTASHSATRKTKVEIYQTPTRSYRPRRVTRSLQTSTRVYTGSRHHTNGAAVPGGQSMLGASPCRRRYRRTRTTDKYWCRTISSIKSGSDCSDGTGDEVSSRSKPPSSSSHKKRSGQTKKYRPLSERQQFSADGTVISSSQQQLIWAETSVTESLSSKGSIDEEGNEVNTSGEFSPKGRAFEKAKEFLRSKEDKKVKEERRRRKEEEKRLKEQQKLKKKSVKSGRLLPQTSAPWGSLEDQRRASDHDGVPVFVVKCVAFIEAEGLNVEGLYRVPGNKAQVDMLLDKFLEDPAVDIPALDIPVNAVATALKHFFSELIAEPLIPNCLYDDLVSAAGVRDPEERLQALDEVMARLPPTNLTTLTYLVSHMYRVTEHSAENSMNSQNLSICWWPTVLRPDIPSLDHMAAMSKFLSDVLQTLIDDHRFFFYKSDTV